MPDSPDFYRVLGVEPDAGNEEIEAAYRKAAVEWHPDVNDSPEATAKMQEINQARDVLLNPMRRMLHNLTNPTYREWAQRSGRWVPPEASEWSGLQDVGGRSAGGGPGDRFRYANGRWYEREQPYEPQEVEPEPDDRPYISNRFAALFVVVISAALIYAFVTEVVLS